MTFFPYNIFVFYFFFSGNVVSEGKKSVIFEGEKEKNLAPGEGMEERRDEL